MYMTAKEKAMDEEEDLGANHQSIQNLLLKENKHYRELKKDPKFSGVQTWDYDSRSY